MAEGQAAQGFVRNLFSPARPVPAGCRVGREIRPLVIALSPLLRALDFWKILRQQRNSPQIINLRSCEIAP
jgi:hypothetical protein